MRALRRILSALLAGALAVFGALTVLEIIRATTGHSSSVLRWRGVPDTLARNSWVDAGPRVASVVAVLLGLLLLAITVRRGRPGALALTSADEDTEVSATRHGIRDNLTQVAEGVEGVEHASVRLSARAVRIKTSAPADAQRLERHVRDAAAVALDGLALARPLRLRVSTKTATKAPS